MSNPNNAEKPATPTVIDVNSLTDEQLEEIMQKREAVKVSAMDKFRDDALKSILGLKVGLDHPVRKAGGTRLIVEISFTAEGQMVAKIVEGPKSPSAGKVAKSGADMRTDYKTVSDHTERGPKDPNHFGLREGEIVHAENGTIGEKLIVAGSEHDDRGWIMLGPDAKVLGTGSLSHLSLKSQDKLGKVDKHGKPLTTRGPEDFFRGEPTVYSHKGGKVGTMVLTGTGTGHDYSIKRGN